MDGANADSAASAKRTSTMTARVLSVLVLLPIVVAAVWQEWSTALIIAVAVVIALRELFAVLRHGGFAPRAWVGTLIVLGLTLAFYAQPFTAVNLFPPLLVLSITGALTAEIARRDRTAGLVNWALTFAGAYYIGGLLSSYLLMRRIDIPLAGGWLAFLAIPPGTGWIFFTLAITWLNDTGAFFAGRRFGRTLMAPQLSPKKSWEGFAGGLAASVATALLAVPLIGLPIALWQAALLGVVGSLCAPLGDLAESMIKRQIGIKDSGQLIPGHGGMLDRIDSMLFTGPIMYYVIILLI
jgi:phosphatidate cytidylyltransferase